MTGIGIDIGGTKVAAGIVDEDGGILATARGPIEKDSHATIVESICTVVDELLAQADRAARAPSASPFPARLIATGALRFLRSTSAGKTCRL